MVFFLSKNTLLAILAATREQLCFERCGDLHGTLQVPTNPSIPPSQAAKDLLGRRQEGGVRRTCWSHFGSKVAPRRVENPSALWFAALICLEPAPVAVRKGSEGCSVLRPVRPVVFLKKKARVLFFRETTGRSIYRCFLTLRKIQLYLS